VQPVRTISFLRSTPFCESVTDVSFFIRGASADGRTLNQCYVEASSLEMARLIVRSRDGRKLRNRPVHVTLNGPGEFLNTVSRLHA